MKQKFEQRDPHCECIRKGAAAIQAIREVSPDAITTIQARVDAQVADSRKDLAAKEQALSAAKAEAQLGAFPPELNALIHDMAERMEASETAIARLDEANASLRTQVEELLAFKHQTLTAARSVLVKGMTTAEAAVFVQGDRVIEKGVTPPRLGVVQSVHLRIPEHVVTEHSGNVPEEKVALYRYVWSDSPYSASV